MNGSDTVGPYLMYRTPDGSTLRCQPMGTCASWPLTSTPSLSFPPFIFMDRCRTPGERSHALLCPDTTSHSDAETREDGARQNRGETLTAQPRRRAAVLCHSMQTPPLVSDQSKPWETSPIWTYKQLEPRSQQSSQRTVFRRTAHRDPFTRSAHKSMVPNERENTHSC